MDSKLSNPQNFLERNTDDIDLWQSFLADGRPPLLLTGIALALVGSFAIFLGMSGHFLPHGEKFLGMNAAQLCGYHDCHILHFMIHDRVAFGGAVVTVGLLYIWLVEFPLRAGEGWAWWGLVLSGAIGFLSFLAWLSYGYLDTWHGMATLCLLLCFTLGLIRSYQSIRPDSLRFIFQNHQQPTLTVDRLALLLTVLGLICAGLVILIGGSTRVFVPQDLQFMKLTVGDLNAISTRLVPLIAHDRAGFGGALLSTGIAMGFCLWFGRMSRSLRQILFLAGSTGFGCAIGTHFEVGYVNWVHLAPALLGAAVFYIGLLLPSITPFAQAASSSPKGGTGDWL